MDNALVIEYAPADEPDKDSFASKQKSITVREQRATNPLIAAWTSDAETTQIAGNRAWVRRGVRNPDNTGADSAVLVLRDGTLISVSSFKFTPAELQNVAASLQAVR